MTLIIHATNIHSGGGAILLTALLESAANQNQGVIALLDARMQVAPALAAHVKVVWVAPSLLQRLWGEWQLCKMAKCEDVVLSMGNLPPLFPVRARSCLFVQNRYLVDKVSTRFLPLLARLRIAVERFWLRHRIRSVDRVFVQTPSMANLIKTHLGAIADIVPFLASLAKFRPDYSENSALRNKKYDFVYVASGEAHKNHRRLFEAWRLLSLEAIFPSLCVTLTPGQYPILDRLLREAMDKGLDIQNIGNVDQEKIREVYLDSKALIFPSTMESLGLPMLEAKEAGLPILAGELDYVRDIAEPVQTFDPLSGISIARAVKRFLGVTKKKELVLTADDFLKKVQA